MSARGIRVLPLHRVVVSQDRTRNLLVMSQVLYLRVIGLISDTEKNVRLQNIVSDNDLQCITNEMWFSEKKKKHEMAMMFPYLFVNIRQYSVIYKNLMWTGCLLCNPSVVGGPVVPWIDSSCLIWTLLLGDLQIVLCIGLILVPNKTCNEQITSFSPECFKVEVYLGVEITPFEINERFTQFIMINSWLCHWLLVAVIFMAVNCRKDRVSKLQNFILNDFCNKFYACFHFVVALRTF